jgi:putative ABC transport system permease protein
VPQRLGTKGIWYLPALAFYWVLAVLLSKSWVVGNTFMGCLMGATVVVGCIGVGLIRLLARAARTGFIARLALRTLERQRAATLSCFLAISLGTLLINLIAETQESLQKEIHLPAGTVLPSLFMFDIQEEQVAGLQQYLKNERLELSYLSPMIRARLQTVNGQPFEKEIRRDGSGTREEETDREFRNRGVNLTYRARLTDAEEIVAGEAFVRAEGQGPAPVSVEKEFASRLRLRLGDRLDFDVQGVPVQARVASLRRIRWNRFQPNFFIQFPPGYLEAAPKTFLGALPAIDWRRKAEIQSGVVERFPNVSLIDVTQVMEKIAGIVAQMAWALTFMAWLALFSGGVVLFSIANHQAQSRHWDLSLLKVLGASFSDLQRLMDVEFGCIGLVASALGVVLALAASYAFSVVLEYVWSVTWWQPLLSIACVTFFTIVIGKLATRRVLRRSPLTLLQTARSQ